MLFFVDFFATFFETFFETVLVAVAAVTLADFFTDFDLADFAGAATATFFDVFLPLKMASQPDAYFSFVPTRVIVTAKPLWY